MSKRELAIASFLVLCLLLSSLGLVLGADMNYQVDRSEDDGFKSEIGNMFIATPLIAIKDPGADMFSYFMFRNITIYNSRIINNATLSVYTVSNQDVDLSGLATIYGLEMDGLEIDDRVSMTTASVVWNVSQVRGLGQWHNVSVTGIVQELINRFNWGYGDNLAFEILAIPGETRHVVAYDYGDPTLTAKLYISYGIGPPVPPGLPGDSTYNSSYDGYDIWFTPGFDQVSSFWTGQMWSDTQEVYPFQEKVAYSNITDRFYVFGITPVPGALNLTYITKLRTDDTWTTNYTYAWHMTDAAATIYFDTHLWTNDTTTFLDVAWINTYPVSHDLYYGRYILNADGSYTNVTAPQVITTSDKLEPPITIMVDSEGYPYVAWGQELPSPNTYTGYVAWSTTNNGTFTHFIQHPNITFRSPAVVESLVGFNPANTFNTYIMELARGANRTMYLSFLAPDVGLADTAEAWNRASGNWTDGSIIGADVTVAYRWAMSASSNMSLVHNASLLLTDGAYKELYEKTGGGWTLVNTTWDTLDIMVMGASTRGPYYTIGHDDGERIVYYRLGNGLNWTLNIELRDYADYDSANIHRWDLTGQQYPPLRTIDNKTIVSYAWAEGTGRYFHDWFYIEDGPQDDYGSYYTVTDENGTIVFTGDTLDDVIYWLEGEDPDPEDPEPSGWEGTPPEFSRFSIRRYFLFIGYFCVWGPIWFFCWRRPSGYYICGGALIMLMGFGLLLQVPYV